MLNCGKEEFLFVVYSLSVVGLFTIASLVVCVVNMGLYPDDGNLNNTCELMIVGSSAAGE